MLELKRALETIRALPEIVAATVKPFEKISDIKVLHGYNNAGGGAPATGAAGSGNGGGLANDITNAALAYRANAPLVDKMLQEVGLVAEGGSLNDLLSNPGQNHLTKSAPVAPAAETARPQKAEAKRAPKAEVKTKPAEG